MDVAELEERLAEEDDAEVSPAQRFAGIAALCFVGQLTFGCVCRRRAWLWLSWRRYWQKMKMHRCP